MGSEMCIRDSSPGPVLTQLPMVAQTTLVPTTALATVPTRHIAPPRPCVQQKKAPPLQTTKTDSKSTTQRPHTRQPEKLQSASMPTVPTHTHDQNTSHSTSTATEWTTVNRNTPNRPRTRSQSRDRGQPNVATLPQGKHHKSARRSKQKKNTNKSRGRGKQPHNNNPSLDRKPAAIHSTPPAVRVNTDQRTAPPADTPLPPPTTPSTPITAPTYAAVATPPTQTGTGTIAPTSSLCATILSPVQNCLQQSQIQHTDSDETIVYGEPPASSPQANLEPNTSDFSRAKKD